jgi:ribokinase
MSRTPRIVVVGSANVDLTFRVPGPPRAGVTEVCRDYALGFGGKGANQAVQAARLGAAVTFIGKVGDDPFGPAVVEQLRREGIATEFVTAAPGMLTGTAVILVEPSGQNSIITHAGPNVTLTAAEVRRAAATIAAADVLLAMLEAPADALAEALGTARAAGVRTVLSPAPPVDFPHELLRLADVCLPNESELTALVGSWDDVGTAAAALLAKGPKAVVVTLGERGAFLLDEERQEKISGRSVLAVDTSGAGDSFAAALGTALAEGKTLHTAAAWANAVAALSVTRAGTQASFPSRVEVEEFAGK